MVKNNRKWSKALDNVIKWNSFGQSNTLGENFLINAFSRLMKSHVSFKAVKGHNYQLNNNQLINLENSLMSLPALTESHWSNHYQAIYFDSTFPTARPSASNHPRILATKYYTASHGPRGPQLLWFRWINFRVFWQRWTSTNFGT